MATQTAKRLLADTILLEDLINKAEKIDVATLAAQLRKDFYPKYHLWCSTRNKQSTIIN